MAAYNFVLILTSTEATGLLAFLLQVLLLGPMQFGTAYTLLIATRGQTVELNQIAVPFQRCYAQSVWGSLLHNVALVAGFVFFGVPFFYLAVRLAFVPYLIVDEELDAISAFRESWRRSKSGQLQIFLTILLEILLMALGLAFGGVGYLPATIWSGLATAYLFEESSVALQGRAKPVPLALYV
jgi:membrane-anchored glycerophosphoryl diester phosphodiesterase (GDPDase)